MAEKLVTMNLIHKFKFLNAHKQNNCAYMPYYSGSSIVLLCAFMKFIRGPGHWSLAYFKSLFTPFNKRANRRPILGPAWRGLLGINCAEPSDHCFVQILYWKISKVEKVITYFGFILYSFERTFSSQNWFNHLVNYFVEVWSEHDLHDCCFSSGNNSSHFIKQSLNYS